MNQGKKFKTRTGYGHIMEDRIVFTDTGMFNRLADIALQGEMKRTLLLFGMLDIMVFYFAVMNYQEGEVLWAAVFGLIGCYIIYGIFRGFKLSAHPIIQRDRIKEVHTINPVYGLVPPGLEITFLDNKGRRKKRTVFLAGSLNKHKQEVNKALQLFQEEGLLK